MTAPDRSAEQAIPTSKALRRAFREAPPLGRGLWLTVLLAIFGTALQVIVPIVVQQIIDTDVLDPAGVDVGGAAGRAAMALAAMVLAAVAGRAAVIRLAVAAGHGLSDLRVETFAHLHRQSVLHVAAERRGSLVARVTSDVETIQDFMDWGGIGMLVGSAQVSLAVTVMVVYRWQLAALVVAGVFLYGILLIWFQRILQRKYDRVRRRVAAALAATSEAITGLPVVRAYGAEEATTHRVRTALHAQFRAEFETGRFGAFLFSSAEIVAGVITAGVIAVGVVTGAAAGTSAGTLLAFLFLVNLLVEPVQLLVEVLDTAQSAAAGLRRVLRELDAPVDVSDPGDGVDLPAGSIDVRFDGVSFRYPRGDDVLRGVDVEIAPGARVAVVGETGSGKTTFTKLVARLLDPREGRVMLAGVSADRVRFASLRDRVAFVPQEGFLFDASIGDNVRYGCPDADDDSVAGAFADLGLGDWVVSLPDGLATEVGERGGRLSAGERQLVALVRAWIADPDLLVLDEATSAVDPVLDVRLRRAIERLTAGRTSITVAHRLSTAEAADEVLVFDHGVLVERGAHSDLVAAGGVYSRLHADWAAGTAL